MGKGAGEDAERGIKAGVAAVEGLKYGRRLLQLIPLLTIQTIPLFYLTKTFKLQCPVVPLRFC